MSLETQLCPRMFPELRCVEASRLYHCTACDTDVLVDFADKRPIAERVAGAQSYPLATNSRPVMETLELWSAASPDAAVGSARAHLDPGFYEQLNRNALVVDQTVRSCCETNGRARRESAGVVARCAVSKATRSASHIDHPNANSVRAE